jgi:hypothetical protein
VKIQMGMKQINEKRCGKTESLEHLMLLLVGPTCFSKNENQKLK